MITYVVTKGSYSDYHICCICSTYEYAQAAKTLYRADAVEEWEIDQPLRFPAGMNCWEVTMDVQGNTRLVEIVDPEPPENIATDWEPTGWGAEVWFKMWARDEEHAVKIANERRIMLLASGEWTTDRNLWYLRRKESQHGRIV